MDRARARPVERPPPAEVAPGIVVPLYNEHDLARSLSPWVNLARHQQTVKAWLVLTDLCVLALCFVAGLAGGYLAAAACFAFFYGVCNGLFTITRGTLPLVLFDPRAYGAIVGRLLVPALLMTAAGPLVYAEVIERWGARSAMLLSLACACLLLATSLGLAWRFGTRQGRAGKPAQGTP